MGRKFTTKTPRALCILSVLGVLMVGLPGVDRLGIHSTVRNPNDDGI